jgi:anti-repressor protein
MNHDLTMDMAKEICMLQHNERGKQARRYFIECEKRLKAVPIPSYQIEDRRERALAWVAEMEAKDKEVEQLKANNAIQAQIIGEMSPKADYMDVILKSKELLTITQIAKDYGMAGGEMNEKLHEYGIQYKQNGEWLLYSKYQAKGYTHSGIYELPNGNTKTYMKWTQKGRLFIYTLLKRKGIVPTIEKSLALF